MARHTGMGLACRLAAFGLAAGLSAAATAQDRGSPWPLHVIDNTSRGADGVKLADANRDGLPDIVTGWEEGGVVRVYLNPGPAKAKAPWPAVTVGRAPNVEDALFVDLDGDGALDVVSCCEGNTRTMFVHWAPRDAAAYLDAAQWKTEPLGDSIGRMQWMFCLPMQVDGRHGVDLVAAGKNAKAEVGWFQAPADPRNLRAWTWHPLSNAGWVMSLEAADMDGDGQADILLSDRNGPLRGCRWLRHPGPDKAADGPWVNHFIGGQNREAMFLTLADLDRDGLPDVINAVKQRAGSGPLDFHRRKAARENAWETFPIPAPENLGGGKGVAVGDVDLDGKPDVVLTCENAGAPRSGVIWLSCTGRPADAKWTAHEISGPRGTKYDLAVLLDLDGDGDLDVLTCEEAENLGVIWYENPARTGPGAGTSGEDRKGDS
ncbi:MAG: VCBS repeat-containing protein [Planctomycetes bacterium]|nr:VCBS repeat-containing protein [Planctomycetota bacterium]